MVSFLSLQQDIMPPKKKDDGASKKPVLIGRVGTNLKVGIVGLPNVGYVWAANEQKTPTLEFLEKY